MTGLLNLYIWKPLKKYFNSISELERDEEYQPLMWAYCGHYMGYIYPFCWSLSKEKRLGTFIFTVIILLIILSTLVLFFITSALTLTVDVNASVQGLATCIYFLFALLAVFLNIAKRDTLCKIFDIISKRMMTYQDFPDKEHEKTIRDRKHRLHKLLKMFLHSVYVAGVALIGFLFWDAQGRQPVSNKYIHVKLPMVLWLPFDLNSAAYYFMQGYEVFLWFISDQLIYGNLHFISSNVIEIIIELEVCTEAIKQQQARSIVLFKESHRFRRDKNIINSMYLLYQDNEFVSIYKNCLRKVVCHHNMILKLTKYFNNQDGTIFFVFVYTSGSLLALRIYFALDESRPIAFRVFSLFLSTNIFAILCFLCMLGQKISTGFADFYDQVYMTSWINTDKKVRKSLGIILTQSMKPVALKAAWIETSLDHAFILAIVQMSYSFINLLYFAKSV